MNTSSRTEQQQRLLFSYILITYIRIYIFIILVLCADINVMYNKLTYRSA